MLSYHRGQFHAQILVFKYCFLPFKVPFFAYSMNILSLKTNICQKIDPRVAQNLFYHYRKVSTNFARAKFWRQLLFLQTRMKLNNRKFLIEDHNNKSATKIIAKQKYFCFKKVFDQSRHRKVINKTKLGRIIRLKKIIQKNLTFVMLFGT